MLQNWKPNSIVRAVLTSQCGAGCSAARYTQIFAALLSLRPSQDEAPALLKRTPERPYWDRSGTRAHKARVGNTSVRIVPPSVPPINPSGAVSRTIAIAESCRTWRPEPKTEQRKSGFKALDFRCICCPIVCHSCTRRRAS
ncbi:hypothetical protein HNQ99_003155 [Rhizorhapis suberifaciens]|uniref:Uncharacterized protein n=1 Tax=Rhizorhapis suberifaciens TaxID=13656 RepID=A0A840HZ23_9SPHN|nr:hypothetical protein [Rhizorhapis suberifaciens]